MADFDVGKIRLELMGTPRVYYGNAPIQVTRKRVRALLFYLGAQQRPVARSCLADVLWPDYDSISAAKNLSIHISYLKKSLGTSIIESKADYISLNPAVSSDIRRFNALASENNADSLLTALSLFRGPFLDGFAMQGAQTFEQWCAEEEYYWNNRFVETSIKAAELLYQSRRYDTALSVLDSACKEDPLNEAICRLRMQIFNQCGNRSAVSRTYLDLTSALNDDLGCPPSPETSAMYQRIISSDEVQAVQTEPPVRKNPYTCHQMVFVGRQSVLRSLSQDHGMHFIVLQGKSGLGKTRIMNEYIKQNNLSSIPIVFRQQEQDIPYLAVIRCIRDIASSESQNNISDIIPQIPESSRAVLCQLVPELNRPRKTPVSELMISTHQILVAFEKFFSCLIGNSPVFISLDDIHFADDSTLELLHYLVSQASFKNVRFIATFRPSLARPKTISFFNTMQRENYLHSIDVGKLDDESMLELLLYYFPEINRSDANNLVSLADGNPYWMKMIIHELGSGAEISSGASFLDDLFKRALYSLSPQTLEIVCAVAVAGESCDAALFNAICEKVQTKSVDNVLTELFSANLISRDYDGNIMFAHSKIYEFIVTQISANPQKIRALHLMIAETLEEVYGDDVASPQIITIAEHYRQSSFPERCAKHAYNAGGYLLMMGNRKQAVSYYKLAYSYLGLPEKLDMLFVMYNNMIILGQNYEASIYIQDAINIASNGGCSEYLLTYRALQRLSSRSEFQELLHNVLPSYTISYDEEVADMLTQASRLNDEGAASPVLRTYILYYLSFYYLIIGDWRRAEVNLWQIIGESVVQSNLLDIAEKTLTYSAIQNVASIVNMRADPPIEELVALQEQVMGGLSVNGLLSSNLGMQALLMNVRGNNNKGISLMNDSIAEARRSGDKLFLSDCLVTQAMLIHKAFPEKSYSMNFEAYTIAKEVNSKYVLVKALAGLVITSSSLSDAERYFSELCQLLSQLDCSSECPKLKTAKNALIKKKERAENR